MKKLFLYTNATELSILLIYEKRKILVFLILNVSLIAGSKYIYIN